MLKQNVVAELTRRGQEVFIRHSVDYSWEDIVQGCDVSGKDEKQRAVDTNTWRSLWRKDKKDKTCLGPSKVFVSYFLRNKKSLLERLTAVKGLDDYNASLNNIHHDLLIELRQYIKPSILESYNAARKPIDLYIEHLVAMAKELNGYRESLIPLLALPLDSKMMARPECFEDGELRRNGIRRGNGFLHVRTEDMYLDLQQALRGRCTRLSDTEGHDIYPIYFDLLWNQRLTRPGRNLFEINPKRVVGGRHISNLSS